MKALWVVNVPLPPMLERLGQSARGSGWWLGALAARLETREDVALTVCHCSPKYPRLEAFEDNRTRYVLVPVPRLSVYGVGTRPMLETLSAVVRETQPDLIDIHGTEYACGQLTPWVQPSVVITLQGFANAVLEHERAQLRSARQKLAWVGRWRRPRSGALALFSLSTLWFRARSERRIFQLNRYYIGRTHWDRERMESYCASPRQYHSIPRILRPAFYEAAWTPAALERRTVFHCGRLMPYKGTEDLMRAIAVLRRQGVALRLRVGGDWVDAGWRATLNRLSRELGLEGQVEFLGHVSATDIARELSEAAVYAHPSHVDNSPNTLAEAMCVGTPCVGSRTGGIPSMLTDGVTGLLHDPGNAEDLAGALGRLMADSGLAVRLGYEARETARRRHDPESVAAKTLAAYQAVLEEEGRRPSAAGVLREAAR